MRFLDPRGGLYLHRLRGLGCRAFCCQFLLFIPLVPLPLPHRRAVVGSTAFVRVPAAVKVCTAEGAAKVLTPHVAGVGDEEDPAVPAPGEKPPDPRLVSQNGAQDDVVIQHEPAHLATGVPAIIQGGHEALLDF